MMWKKWKGMTEEAPPSPLPLTFSNSADTVENCSLAVTLAKRLVELPSPTPVTPQGLKPRRSVSSISQELNLNDSKISRLASPPPSHPMAVPPLSVLSSPLVSTSSFYSDGGRLHVAESPVLLPGQARTAVGALVAASHAKSCQPVMEFPPPSVQSSLRASSTAVNVSQQSILPPFDENEFQHYLRHHDDHTHELPPPLTPPVSPYNLFASTLHPGQSARTMMMMMSPDMVESCRSPGLVPRRAGVVQTPERPRSLLESLESGASSMDLSVQASPSSMDEAPAKERTTVQPHVEMGAKLSNDAVLQQRKQWHQRRAREDLFLAIFERLQDDLDSVYEIDRQEGELVVCAGAEGLLTGLLPATRSRIVGILSQLLLEMEVTDELFLSSPTDIAAVAVPHCHLRDTLQFCLQLVRVAPVLPPPFGDSHRRWRLVPGVKASLGLIPESPPTEQRGGDTSVFSLPCDDSAETPMTSNVSLSTTITTRSPDFRGAAPLSQQQHPALDVRRAIARVSSLLDRLSALLLRDDELPVQELKRVYTAVHGLDATALKAAVEAFELAGNDDDEDPLLELQNRSPLGQEERDEVEDEKKQEEDSRPLPPPRNEVWGILGPPCRGVARSSRQAADLFFSPLLQQPVGTDGDHKKSEKVRWWATHGVSRRRATGGATTRLPGGGVTTVEGRDDGPESPRPLRGDPLHMVE